MFVQICASLDLSYSCHKNLNFIIFFYIRLHISLVLVTFLEADDACLTFSLLECSWHELEALFVTDGVWLKLESGLDELFFWSMTLMKFFLSSSSLILPSLFSSNPFINVLMSSSLYDLPNLAFKICMALQVSSYVISPFLSMSRNENTLSSSCTVGMTGVFIFGST